MTTKQNYGQTAIARADARHERNNSIPFNAATFFFDGRRYQIEVRGYIVAACKTTKEVLAFCATHNGRLADEDS